MTAFPRFLRALAPTIALISFSVPARAEIDFRVQSASTTSTGLRRHLTFETQSTIENLGTTPSAVQMRYELVSLTPSATRYRVPTQSLPGTGPFVLSGERVGGAGTFLARHQVPAGLPFGQYRLELSLDPDHLVADVDRTNNAFVIAPIVTLLPTADLVVGDAEFVSAASPPEFDAGETMTVRTRFWNSGDLTDLPQNTARFYLVESSRTTYPYGGFSELAGPTSVFLGSRTVPAIPANLQTPGATFTFNSTFTLPANLDLLRYAISIHLNPNGTIPEQNSPTYVFGDEMTVEYVNERPDFVAVDTTGNATGVNLTPGDFVTLTGRISNFGLLPSPGTTVIEHRFRTRTGPANSYLVGTTPLPPLAVGQHHDFNVSLPVPVGLPAGSYDHIFEADGIDVIDERLEGNNRGENQTKVYHVSPASLPDLSGSGGITAGPAVVEAGDPVSLSLVVSNNGGQSSAACQARFHVVPHETPFDLSLTGTTLIVASVPKLDPGESTNLATSAPFPSLAGGSYSIRCLIDSIGQVGESNESNNLAGSSSGTITLLPPLSNPPDLVPSAITSATSLAPAGQSMSVTIQIANGGSSPSGNTGARLYLSADSVAGGSDDILLSSFPCPTIAAGGRADIVRTVTIPAAATGTYHWVVDVDDTDLVPEGDEINNLRVFDSPVFAIDADKEASRPVVFFENAGVAPRTLAAGERLTAAATLINAGDFPASRLKVNLYLSSTSQFSPASDVLLHEFAPEDLAGSGATRDLSTLVSLPEGTALGNHFILWVADPDSEIPRTPQDPVVAAHPITLRERKLRLEYSHTAGTADVLLLHDTDPARTYTVRHSSELNFAPAQSGFTAPQAGQAEFPLQFSIQRGNSPPPFRFFRADDE